MYIVLGLLFKHRPLEKHWILLNAALAHSEQTEHEVSQFSWLFNSLCHNCMDISPWAMCYALLALEWLCIKRGKIASFKTYYL